MDSQPLKSSPVPSLATAAAPVDDVTSIARVADLLKATDDTHRFVGLALLKSLLDNSLQLRRDVQAIQLLWDSLSARFVDRLLRTGSNPSNQNAQEMLDLAVSILHTFAALLPDTLRETSKFTDRIPGLVDAVLYCSQQTARLVMQLLRTLVSSPKGALALIGVHDLSPLTEAAPVHTLVLDILRFAWLNAMASIEDRRLLCQPIDTAIQGLCSSFIGTDAVTLLDFLASFLSQADLVMFYEEPTWLTNVSGYIQTLVVSRSDHQARSAYTNAAASLLKAYTLSAPRILFTSDAKTEKPFAYLFVNLVLIDLGSSLPTLLERLNAPEYPEEARRLASAFDVVCIFVGYLIRSLEDDASCPVMMSPDRLLKIRKSLSDTMSVTTEYLWDRWDASVAGAMGLHPDARAGNIETSTDSRRTLIWDSLTNAADDDPLLLSAVRALALLLKEDEDWLSQKRKEMSGLTDVFLDLYRASAPEKMDFRSPILVALDVLVTVDRGREQFLRNGGWQMLSNDLSDILGAGSNISQAEASRGTDIVRVLLSTVEHQATERQSGGTSEEWMRIVTSVAAWKGSIDPLRPPEVQEFLVAILQLSCTLLMEASLMMRNRHRRSISAISSTATQLKFHAQGQGPVGEAMEDVVSTLDVLMSQHG